MADPNRSPVGSDAGALSPPDESRLYSDISDIEARFEPRIEEQEARSESMSQASVTASEDTARFAEQSATDMTAQDQELQNWLDHTPTRQASYATSMHAAPVLAILTALGGKLTRLNGLQMLSATKGIVDGLNTASEAKYNDALQSWQAAFQRMQEHQRRLKDAINMQLTAYQGRADAYQKAVESARRMTEDLLDDKQRQIAQKIDLFKAQAAAWDKLQRVNLAREHLKVYEQKEVAQEAHWKELENDKRITQNPAAKQALSAAKQRWQNAKAQMDENLKLRGQVSNSLTMPEAERTSYLARIDDSLENLRKEMDEATNQADSAVNAAPAPLNPGSVTPPEQSGRGGVIQRPGQPTAAPAQASPKKQAVLEQHKGKPVKFGDGSTWIMEADGSVHQVQ